MKKDILGIALLDYQNGNYTEDIITSSTISEEDEMPIPYLFRSFKEMPKIEQKALQLAKGKVLDIGCGAGSHSLYLQDKAMEVTALDTSEGAIEVCISRGLKKVLCQSIFDLKEANYDTLLLMMNGTGICGTLDNLGPFLAHLKGLLAKGGQILIDSSDIIYMFEDEDGEYWIDSENGYYGQIQFKMAYKGDSSEEFPWLYLDYNTLQRAASFNGFKCEMVQEGEHYDYLAQLTLLD